MTLNRKLDFGNNQTYKRNFIFERFFDTQKIMISPCKEHLDFHHLFFQYETHCKQFYPSSERTK